MHAENLWSLGVTNERDQPIVVYIEPACYEFPLPAGGDLTIQYPEPELNPDEISPGITLLPDGNVVVWLQATRFIVKGPEIDFDSISE